MRPDGRGHRRRTGTASVSAGSSLRDLSAVRVIALVATCALHAAAFLALMRPPPSAPRLPSQRMTVVLIDLSGVEATPPAAPAPLAAAALTLPEPRRPSPQRSTTRTAAPSPTPAPAPVASLPVAADEAAQSQSQHDVAEATVREDRPAEASASASARDAVGQDADAVAVAAQHASDWQAIVLAHLERHRRYPFAAQRAREQGTADLRFRVDRRGRVLAAWIERSSGSAALDEEAVAVVRRAEPLPSPPPEIAGETLELVVPVRFRLR
jgi:protein TonB